MGRVLTLVVMLIATGCPIKPGPDPDSRSTIYLLNESQEDIRDFNLIRADAPIEDEWGKDWLPGELECGEMFVLEGIPGDYYDLRVVFGNSEEFLRLYEQEIGGGLYVWRIVEGTYEPPLLVSVDTPPAAPTCPAT